MTDLTLHMVSRIRNWVAFLKSHVAWEGDRSSWVPYGGMPQMLTGKLPRALPLQEQCVLVARSGLCRPGIVGWTLVNSKEGQNLQGYHKGSSAKTKTNTDKQTNKTTPWGHQPQFSVDTNRVSSDWEDRCHWSQRRLPTSLWGHQIPPCSLTFRNHFGEAMGNRKIWIYQSWLFESLTGLSVMDGTIFSSSHLSVPGTCEESQAAMRNILYFISYPNTS